MKKKSIIAIIAAAAIVIGLGVSVFAYDSSTDPIVSLSYLTDIFKPMMTREFETKIDSKVSEAVSKLGGSVPSSSETPSSSDSGYVVVELGKDDELYAEDACDIMLRSGSAVCIAPDEKQGIADYTDATEIMRNQSLVKNHMCLIPRGDGRGVRATSDSVYIMVRGSYIIVNH